MLDFVRKKDRCASTTMVTFTALAKMDSLLPLYLERLSFALVRSVLVTCFLSLSLRHAFDKIYLQVIFVEWKVDNYIVFFITSLFNLLNKTKLWLMELYKIVSG